MEKVKLVDLVDGVCPECGADYCNEPVLTVDKVDDTIGDRKIHTKFRRISAGEIVTE